MAGEIVLPTIPTTIQYVLPLIPILIVIVIIGMIFFIIWKMIRSSREMSKILYIQSPEEVELFKKKIDDIDKVTIKTTSGKKTYNLTKTKPLMLKTFFGRQAMYLVGATSPLGLEINVKKIQPIHNPDVINKMIESKLVKDIVESSPDGKKFDIFIFAAGVAVGIAALFVMKSMGVLAI